MERKPKGGAHKVGDLVRLKEDGVTGKIVDFERGKFGSPDEYAIVPEDLEEGGPSAIWVRADEIGADADEDHGLEQTPGGMTPGDRGVASAGGGTPADRGSAAAAEDAEWEAGYGQDASQGWEADAGYKTFDRGQKVRTRTGAIRTVISQRGAQVFVDEESNGWYHPGNLRPVYWSNELGWVTIPDREDEVKKSLAGIVSEAFQEVVKDNGWAPGPNAGWRRITGEDGQPKKHTTRDGVVIEDQPKVTRVGGEQYQVATSKGQVVLDFADWKWLGGGGKPNSPPLHERGNWMVWPRGADEDDYDNLIQSGFGKTLAEFMASIEPGEYKLAT